MKTLFYFFLFPLLLISSQSLCQSSEVPDVGAIWVEADKGMISMSLPVVTEVESDTTIGDYNYKKIGSGFFRDSLNVWYVIAEGDSVEHMYYDFTVQLGDTVYTVNPMIDEEDRAPYLEVTSIDSLQLLDGSWKKRISLYYENEDGSEGSYDRWVEDLGSTLGILRNGRLVGIDGDWTDLVCFTDAGGQTLYEEPVHEDYGYIEFIYEDCYWTVGVEEIDQAELEVFPNPVNDILSVRKVNGVFGKASSFEIVDLRGRSVYQEKTAGGEGIIELDLSSLNPGIYLLRMSTENGKTLTEKIVVN